MRESRYLKIARLAYQIAKQELPLYSHPKTLTLLIQKVTREVRADGQT